MHGKKCWIFLGTFFLVHKPFKWYQMYAFYWKLGVKRSNIRAKDHLRSMCAKFFQKLTFLTLFLTYVCACACACQGVRNNIFLEKFAYILNEWSPSKTESTKKKTNESIVLLLVVEKTSVAKKVKVKIWKVPQLFFILLLFA